PLVFPSREVLRRVHREAVEVVVGGRAVEELAVQVIGVADHDDAAAMGVHQLSVGVVEAHARRVRRRYRRRRVGICEAADLRARRDGAARRATLAGGAAGSAAPALAAGSGRAAGRRAAAGSGGPALAAAAARGAAGARGATAADSAALRGGRTTLAGRASGSAAAGLARPPRAV